ncbi:peptidylprolyl isomerase [Planctomycetaceae bacterium SH139]
MKLETQPRRGAIVCRRWWLLISLASSLLVYPCSRGQAQQLSDEEIAKLRQMELPTDSAAVLAIVGEDHILVGDLLPKVNQQILQAANVDLSLIPPEELRIVRLKLIREALKHRIETKMLAQAFLLEQVGSASAEQRREAKGRMELQTRKMFWKEHVPRLKEQLKLVADEELEAFLVENGTSIKAMEAEYMDMMIREAYWQDNVPRDPEVSLNEIRIYYNQNRAKFETTAKARWEQLTVRFDKFPTRAAAVSEIEDMFREARFGGNVQSVAKQRSQGPLAAKGGLHDWTSKGSLRSKPLDQNIFSLPLNRLSPIIEDEDGLHVVRVLERRPAGIRPLGDVQDEIREEIKAAKRDAAKRELMADLRRQVPVWSRYPGDIPAAMPLPQLAAGDSDSRKR